MAVSQEDTPVIKMTAQADALTATKLYKINFLYWYNPAGVDGDLLQVTDEADNDVWLCSHDGVADQYICPLKNPILGLKIPDLDRGTLFVYLSATYPGQY